MGPTADQSTGTRKAPLGQPFAVVWLVLLILLGTDSQPAAAQQVGDLDWRANLSCPEALQLRAGVQYCTGADRNNALVHVIVVDLTEPGVRFEYVLPKGYSSGQTTLKECRDPNVPAWAGPAGGCYVPGNSALYPRMTLEQAVERAREIRQAPAVAAVIDADYGSPEGTHGPEGLLVVRGDRLDGAANCDDDFNAVLRPWLALGESIDPAIGQIPVELGRLQSDSTEPPSWIHTGIGGGPWLVRNGQLYPGSASCQGDRTINQLEPITNCTGNQKEVSPPKVESYGSGSCRTAPHTAAGISPDRRWLFLAMSTGSSHPDILAEFMLLKLGVSEAIKFDGGGSSQMWIAGNPDLTIDAGGVNRALTNYLSVYADAGSGLKLPLSAAVLDTVTYMILNEGQGVSLDPTFRNDGDFTWKAEDGVALHEKAALGSVFGEDKIHALPQEVLPGTTVSWNLPSEPRGVQIVRFQMAQDGDYFGQEEQFLVVVIPEALQDRREEIEDQIEQFIEEMQEEGEQQLEDLAARIQEWLVQEAQRMLEEAARNLWDCNGALFILALPVVSLIRAGRRRYRKPPDSDGGNNR